MKHNTHIYIAAKAIEFTRDAVDNLYYASGRKAPSKRRTTLKRKAKELQRLLRYHQDTIAEASWAPDDVIHDKSLFHTFKLFTTRDFDDAEKKGKSSYVRDKRTYYRTSGAGGLPFKVDHLARCIADMDKLRDYNDHFLQKQIMYLYLMISHYVVDAHVPMHCDIRDDPPSKGDRTKPRKGKYYDDSLHGTIEGLWEEAATPVALAEEIFVADTYKDCDEETELSPQVRFNLKSKEHSKQIKTKIIPDRGLMDFMITICAATKERSLILFPASSPNQWDQAIFPEFTREVFADAIGNLVSIWLWMWDN